MYSQAPKASSWGICETAKHHIFQVPKCAVKHPMPRSRAPAKQPSTMYFRSQTASKTQPLTSLSEDLKTMYSQPNTMYFRSQTAWKTQPLTSLSEDLKTMYNQAPKASFSAACETAKHHVLQVPKGVKNTASNVTFWRPKDNVQSSTQSLVLGSCETANHHVFEVPKGVKNTASNVTFSGTCETAKHLYFRSQTASKKHSL